LACKPKHRNCFYARLSARKARLLLQTLQFNTCQPH